MSLGVPSGYQLDSAIGSGGHGTVYLGRDDVLSRELALKCVPVAGLREVDTQALLSEGRQLAKVAHPNCARILDVERTTDALWFVMEYIPGPTLQELLDMGDQLTRSTALAMVRDLADVLAQLAELGLVHHDVKPGNVIVSPARGAVLVDFGSCLEADRPQESNGSMAFMAPERLGESRHRVGAGADVYALGVLAYWLVAGFHPFAPLLHDPAAMARAHRTQTPLRTSQDTPSALRRAIRSATHPNPRRRISAAELSRLLHRFTEKENSWVSAQTAVAAS